MKQSLVLVLLASGLVLGCRKHSEGASTATVEPTNQTTADNSQAQPGSASNTLPSPAATSTGQTNAPAAPDFRTLNRQLRAWIMQHGHTPKNFEEFAASANVPIPPPPPGKKYVIDSLMHVSLTDR